MISLQNLSQKFPTSAWDFCIRYPIEKARSGLNGMRRANVSSSARLLMPVHRTSHTRGPLPRLPRTWPCRAHLVPAAFLLQRRGPPGHPCRTTKVEAYNDFLDWVSFGGPVIKSGDPVEQEKQLKYASLVANAVMLSNVADLTRVLSEMAADGQQVTPALVACLSSYIRRHILRFGRYTLDMDTTPEPLNPQPLPFEQTL